MHKLGAQTVVAHFLLVVSLCVSAVSVSILLSLLFFYFYLCKNVGDGANTFVFFLRRQGFQMTFKIASNVRVSSHTQLIVTPINKGNAYASSWKICQMLKLFTFVCSLRRWYFKNFNVVLIHLFVYFSIYPLRTCLGFWPNNLTYTQKYCTVHKYSLGGHKYLIVPPVKFSSY